MGHFDAVPVIPGTEVDWSVAALIGSLAGALTGMVANLTVGKKGYRDVAEEMRAAAVTAQSVQADLLAAVDRDSAAFDGVMVASRLPKKTDAEKACRQERIEAATREAIEVPLSALRRCCDLLDTLEFVADKGNENSLSDAGVAAKALLAAASGTMLNVLINLPGVSDASYIDKTRAEARSMCDEVARRAELVYDSILARLDAS